MTTSVTKAVALPGRADIVGGGRVGPGPDDGRPDRERHGGWAAIGVWLAALLALLADRPGQMFFETKLGVVLDPAGFLARLWHLWNPLEWFGTLQDQYVGYAFPMGPYYLITHDFGIPVWFAERLWLSLLIAAGFWGLFRLATALDIGSHRSRLIASLAFAVWPAFTMIIGSTSGGVIGGLLAPWAVLPLVRATRGGPVIPAAARSGVAILAMGGVNATVTLDALVLPALFIIVQARGAQRIRLAGAWFAAVGLAVAWWALPLILQGRYAFNFLPYIEQSSTTTATMSASTFLRGAGDWTGYLNFGTPWLTAGWAMVTNPLAIVASAVAAGFGLAGVARRDLPYALWLRASLALAALAALVGYPGPMGGPLHGLVGHLLDGPAAPFRNLYKLEPAAAAILALGIAHVVSRWWPHAPVRSDRVVARDTATVIAVVVVLAGLSYPYLTGQVLNPGSFKQVPNYWYRVAAFLARQSPRAPALVVPAASHGTYVWGEPIDEPLEPLASSPWVERGLVPYGGAGSQLLLNSLEGALESGEPVPGLAATLRRSGIRYVVLRNDLDPGQQGYVSPQLVQQSLRSSGFHRVATFGPAVTLPASFATTAAPAVEIFAPRGASGEPPPSPVAVLPTARTALISGGPDGLLQLSGQGLLAPSEPAVVAGDRLAGSPARWLVTDSLRRADHAFGQVDPGQSYTYTATGVNPPDDPLGAAGLPPRQILPVAAAGHQTVAVISGAASVTASSAGSWLDESARADPVGAFDRNRSTAWVEASPVTPVGQWVQIKFRRSMRLGGDIKIALLDDSRARPVATRLEVATAAGHLTSRVRPDGAVQPLAVPVGLSRWLRITIAGARGGIAGGPGAGIRDVLIPGVRVTRFLRVPERTALRRRLPPAFSFQQSLPSPGALGDPAGYPPLAREFVVPRPERFKLSASAVALPGPQVDAILGNLAPHGKKGVEITASSTWPALPVWAAASLLGKNGRWLAAGQGATLHLSWRGARTISLMVLTPLRGFGAAPESVKISSTQGVRFASVGVGGLTAISPPLRTSSITISFPIVQYVTSQSAFTAQAQQQPVGLSRLTIPALKGLRPALPDPAYRFALPCGQGPTITLGGRRYQTAVTGTAGDLEYFRPLRVRLCLPGPGLNLGSGAQRLVVAVGSPFAITGVRLAPERVTTGSDVGGAAAPPSAGVSRTVRVLRWQPDTRLVRIGPGPAAYLEVHQNANIGWQARLDGRVLRPARLDGWQQAFVIPAGRGGTVVLSYAPTAVYRAFLVGGLIGAVLLVIVAVWRPRRRRQAKMAETPSPAGAGGVAELLVRHRDVARAQACADPYPTRRSRRLAAVTPADVAWLVGLCGLMALIGGLAAFAVPAVAIGRRLWPAASQVIALVSLLASGVITAAATGPSVVSTGAFGAPAQVCALLALAIALCPVVGRPGDAVR